MIKQDLEHIAQLVYNNFNIPLFIFNTKTQRARAMGNFSKSPMFDSEEQFINRLIQTDNQQSVPLIHITNYLETFILIHLSLAARLVVMNGLLLLNRIALLTPT